jgi:hypothetical protein
MHSFHIIDGLVFEWTNGMPSGNPLTPIINTIYNNILIRMCWYLSGLDLSIFKHLVSFFANGDDNAGSISPAVRDKFNPKIISEKMDILGMTYTNDTKSGDNDRFRTISDITFLKRKFVYNKRYHRWLAPLDINVVKDMINWTHKGKEFHVTVSNNMYTVIRELSLHGETEFNKCSQLLLSSYKSRCKLSINSKCYWDYDDVLKEVLTSDKHYI